MPLSKCAYIACLYYTCIARLKIETVLLDFSFAENRKHLNNLIDKIANEEITREQLLQESNTEAGCKSLCSTAAADSTTPEPSPVKAKTATDLPLV